MPPVEHGVPAHNNHPEGVGARADGQDTKCGISQAEACGPEECLAEPIDMRAVEVVQLEEANPVHPKQPQKNNHSSAGDTQEVQITSLPIIFSVFDS